MAQNSLSAGKMSTQWKLPKVNALFYFLVALFLFWPTRFARIYYESIPGNEIAESLLMKTSKSRFELADKGSQCDYTDLIKTNFHFYTKQATTDVINRTEIRLGGEYWPKQCDSSFSTAIVVPYRNRPGQLKQFLSYMHSYLRKQNIHYKIFIVEQNDEKPFNRAKLLNIGATFALKENFPCLVMHDVDLLPLKLGNIYACTTRPRHMSSAIDSYRFTLPYYGLVGGAVAFPSEIFQDINGFSNLFEGWGGEDDDLFKRLVNKNYKITRFHPSIAQYTMLKHKKETPSPKREKLLSKGSLRFNTDGLNSLDYHEAEVVGNSLYTNISVKL